MKQPHLRAVGEVDAEKARERDLSNQRSIRIAPALFLSPDRRAYLLEAGTAGEREAAAVMIRRKVVVVLTLGAIAVFGPMFIPRDPPAAAPEPVTIPVGAIQSLDLHETAFSTSTTVRTAEGIFQVHGAVSAKEGDSVTLKALDRPGRTTQREVCIESTIKRACYAVKE